MRSILLVVTFLVISYPIGGSPACSCHFSDDRFEEAKAVFFGEVLDITRIHVKREVVTVKIERVFKGGVKDTVAVISDRVCRYNFKVGARYLIYAGEHESGELESGPCRILYEELAKEEMKYLEKGEKPKTRL